MRQKIKNPIEAERRKYIRLDSVFPVQFRLLAADGKSFISDWLQGFTNNVGKGGICLFVNNLKPEMAGLIQSKQVKLSLNIEIPLGAKPVPALANVVWVKESPDEINKYFIGAGYEQIEHHASARILHFAWGKKLFAPVALSIIVILAAGLTLNAYVSFQLIKGNKSLVSQLVAIVQESSVAKQKIKEINKQKEELQVGIQALKLRTQTVEGERAKLEEKAKLAKEQTKLEVIQRNKKIAELNSLISKLTQEKSSSQERLISLQNQENNVSEEFLRLDKSRAILQEANFAKMYQWLKIHQNPRTGLVMSFEGDSDISEWAFTYDQSLLVQAYTIFADFDRAKKIIDFYQHKAERVNGLFLNSYYATDGKAAEYIVHSGPNIWLGIAVLQYTKEANDPSYISLAEDIAQGIISLQEEDREGGIRGGPDVTWYATEHNLDAYAFFNMLYNVTGKNKYAVARDKVMKWLVLHTYDKSDVPIKRGKGDSTIATDTYAWSIAAIGPEKLEAIGMNPDKIIDFAEKNCSATVSFVRPEGKTIIIKGFDFAPQRHVSRGGVVSSEWTAQMVVAYKIMSEFYYKKGMIAKSRAYRVKADSYLLELSSMIISSPSPSGQGEGCLPYATQEFVDTGHGWKTPKGKATGSVAGTTYTLFAYYNYNPLQIKATQ
ncbi:MAG: hypothetical protein PHQ57_03225 [Candidatus Omnitrophica bacterium]|nr:hypothetical protein [Candidatus Omnitrophota bacterium]